jgi:hypothetical protein
MGMNAQQRVRRGCSCSMARFSILMAMAVVALVAANLGLARAVVPDVGTINNITWLFVVGLLPLVDAQIIGVYCLIAPRYRIWLRRRAPEEWIGFAPIFTVLNGLALAIAIGICVMASDAAIGYLQYVGEPIGAFLESLPLEREIWHHPIVRFVESSLVGAVMSGPPLIFALTMSWLSRRYKLVIVPRPRPVLVARQTGALPGDTQPGDDTP